MYNPVEIVIGDRSTYDGVEPIYGPTPDAAGREQVPCVAAKKSSRVIVALGQSNAANFAAGCHRTQANVMNFNLYDAR